MYRPNFGPFKGIEYFLACADAARQDAKQQIVLIQHWMNLLKCRDEISDFLICECSQLNPETKKPVPAFVIDYSISPTQQGRVVIETMHLTKEAAVCMHIHDS